jgi:hypothetical protein
MSSIDMYHQKEKKKKSKANMKLEEEHMVIMPTKIMKA